MKAFLYAIGMVIVFALPASAWAQQDLEVTIRMVPADAAADAATKVIPLPDSLQAQESSAFGIGIANKAREMRGEFGRDIGQAVSEAASQHGQEQSAAGRSRQP